MTWGELLDCWELVAQDLQEVYGINVFDRSLMRAMPGIWLRSNVAGLLTKPPVGYLEERVDDQHLRRNPIYATRVQVRFWGPETSTG